MNDLFKKILSLIVPIIVSILIFNFVYGSIKFLLIVGVIIAGIIFYYRIKNGTDSKTKSNFENSFIFEVDDFLSSYECNELINKNNNNLTKSEVLSNDKYSNGRTSMQKWLPRDNYNKLNNKLLKLANKYSKVLLTEKNGENIQFAVYNKDQKYDGHYDICDPVVNTENFIENCKEDYKHFGSVRHITILVYLNDDYEGGETYFQKLNKKIKPKKGKALVFLDCNLNDNSIETGLCDKIDDSLHSGLPIKNGQKFIINKWFRIKEFD